ncbi:MAG TPA: type IV-A pilus assembly ATPase PilB [Candidatus Udaeobacter sp.]|nr:type IV-A pilus assembly ATPase PilB [Candidatus Udaeobacter sp.]
MKDIGHKLVEGGFIDGSILDRLERQQKSHGGSLGLNLVKLGILTEQQLTQALSSIYRVPGLNLAEATIDQDAVKLLPQEIATKFQVLPVKREGRRLQIAMADPGNIFAIDDIKFITGYEVEPTVAAESAIKRLIDRHYDQADAMRQVMADMQDDLEVVEETTDEVDLSGLADESAPVVKLVNSVLADAVRKGASDIHIEPYERMVRVRYRIDGTLYEVMSPPFKLKAAITSRIKIMAELDIAERRIPQDGRIKIKILDRTIDLRVSTLPTIFGEKVVMRILDKGNLRIDLTQFGMGDRAFKDLVRAVEAPYGMVLVTGPTGSGKTTTLYSALSRVSVPGVNIMTAEDPVEYNIEGINQVQINDDIGLTFAAALRAFLRQDPNIVMVGEIRDLDTASIATKAALTGHLVLSTLHTNDAPSTVNRLVDMGVEPFLVASSTNLIMAQRLVRRLCSTCKVESQLHEEVARELEVTGEPITKIYEPRGCLECAQTGYRGRQGLYEVMPISPAIRELILDRAPAVVIKKQANTEGMLTLRMDGILKIRLGVTSPGEVLKETAADRLGG